MLSGKSPDSTARKRVLLRLLTVTLSSLFTLVLCEIGLRVAGYRPNLLDPNMYVAGESELMPYRLRAGYDGVYLGKHVKIDSDGYRLVAPDDMLAKAKPVSGFQRSILLLGDSIVFGHGLGNDETIGSQLQNALLARNFEYRVHNAGAPGYTSWNEWALLDEFMRAKRADLVIVLFVTNDVTFNNDVLGVGQGKYRALSDSSLHQVTQFLYRNVYVSYLLRDSFQRAVFQLSREREGQLGDAHLDEAAMAYSVEALSRMKALCERVGAHFEVGVFRDLRHYSDPETSVRFERKIAEYLDKREIKFFPVHSHVTQLSLGESRVFWNDPHPSSKAVGLIVKDILAAVEPLLSRS